MARKGSLTSPEKARRMIEASYRQTQYRRMYYNLCHAFGASESKRKQSLGGDGINECGDNILYFPDIPDDWTESGTLYLIRAAQMISLARYFGKDPVADYNGIDPLVAELRRDFWRSAYVGADDAELGFGPDVKAAWLDLDALGAGACMFGLVEDSSSKEMRADGKHIPRLQWLYDRHAPTPTHSAWFTEWEYMEEDVAIQQFGRDMVMRARKLTHFWSDSDATRPQNFVRVLTYWDRGYAGKDPTRIIWVGSLDAVPIVEKNPYGRIPVAFGVGFTPPGKRRAEGRIHAQVSTQDGLQAITDYTKDVLGFGTIDLFDSSMMSEEEFERVRQGAGRVRANLEAGRTPFSRIPAQEIPQTLLAYRDILEREYNRQSGFSEMDMSNTLSRGRSASEILVMDARMKMNQAIAIQQTLEYQRLCIKRFEQAAMIGDWHPRSLNVRGRRVDVNVKGRPESWIGNFVGEPAEVVLTTDSMTSDEDQLRRNVAIENLMKLGAGLQSGQIDAEWWFRELVELTGFNSEQALRKMQPEDAAMAAMGSMGNANPMLGAQSPPNFPAA